MNKSDFYFDLPSELIAQVPIKDRSKSRLMQLNKETGQVTHHIFDDIVNFFNAGDLLVLNNSKVIPARIYAVKKETGANLEFLLLKQVEKDVWEVLCKPAKKAKIGSVFTFSQNKLEGTIIDFLEDGKRLIKFTYTGKFYSILDEIGEMPLPPYINEKLNDNDRYQTVYAKTIGSSAAPTAGLHFTNEILQELKNKGVNIAFVTLHVGLGTFRPVKESDLQKHIMHSENFAISDCTATLIKETKKLGNKVYAVGTTSCRVLEGTFKKFNGIQGYDGDTDIFIYPPYKFNVIDGLITNFHLSESSLIMLVSAFSGYESTMNAYKVAIDEKYRFFSFGDAMLIR